LCPSLVFFLWPAAAAAGKQPANLLSPSTTSSTGSSHHGMTHTTAEWGKDVSEYFGILPNKNNYFMKQGSSLIYAPI
jgi:hypothetical protein